MSIETYQFNLPITPGAIPPVLHLSQYDSGRTFTAVLRDDANVPFELDASATAVIKGRNAAGIAWQQDCTVSGANVTFTPSGAATDQFGVMPVTIEITESEEIISPLCVVFHIQKAGYTNEEAVLSPDFETAIQAAVEQAISEGGLGFSDEFKEALLACFNGVAWATTGGQALVDDLEDALYPEVHLTSITAAYDQDRPIYDTSSLDLVRLDLVVTANYSDGTSEVVTDYTLSGTLVAGQTCEITVSYGGKTATINVVVMSLPGAYQAVEYIEATGTQYIVLDSNFGTVAGRLSANIECSIEESQNTQGLFGVNDQLGQWFGRAANKNVGFGSTAVFTSIDGADFNEYQLNFGATKVTGICGSETVEREYGTLASGKLTLFCLQQNNGFAYKANAKIAACEITVDGQLAYNLVPCYKKSDGTIGMYDIVGNTFYTNDGSGTFLKGGDI